MVYKTENKIIIELDSEFEEELVNAIKGIIFCIRNQDYDTMRGEENQWVLWLLEQLIPAYNQINLSKKPE